MTAATPELMRLGYAQLACPVCGWRFFTTVGRADHLAVCQDLTAQRRRRENLRATGLRVTALNNSRRVRCLTCDRVSTPSGIGVHQRFTGHIGRDEAR